jgi:hypothetical protein
MPSCGFLQWLRSSGGVAGPCIFRYSLAVFSTEDMYSIHFRVVIHMSNTQAVRATVDLREREGLDENNQV